MKDIAPTDVRRLQEFVDAVWPEHQGGELVVWLPNQKRAVLPLRVYFQDFEDSNGTQTALEKCIMQAVEENAADCPLTGQKIADLAGYAFAGHFRTTMAGLVKKRRLISTSNGYSLNRDSAGID